MSIMGNFYGSMAYFNHAKGNLQKAEILYQKAYLKGISNPNIVLGYGVLLLRKGDFQKARELFEDVLKHSLKPNMKSIAEMNLALSLWKLGHVNEAVEFLSVVHQNFRSSRVYESLGYLLIEKGDYEKALEYNTEGLEYDRDNPAILDNMGQLYYRTGELGKAKEFFEKAIAIKSNQADSHYYLGCIAADIGEIDKAVEHLESALKYNTSPLNTVDVSQINLKLQKLQAHISGT